MWLLARYDVSSVREISLGHVFTFLIDFSFFFENHNSFYNLADFEVYFFLQSIELILGTFF